MEEKKKKRKPSQKAKWQKKLAAAQELLEISPRKQEALLDEAEAAHNLALLEKGSDKERHTKALANIAIKRKNLA